MIVDYKFCIKCKYFRTKHYEEPCNECLTLSGREDTRQPLNFVEKK